MYSNYLDLLKLSDDELSRVDPVVVNLLVAKSIPSLSHIDIPKYVALADEWTDEFRVMLQKFEHCFHRDPQDWDHDIHMFRIGELAGFLFHTLKITYNEHQRDVKRIKYTNPSDLFLTGVMDTRQGTCGNMCTLYAVMARRMGWAVYLCMANCHHFCRFDNGNTRHNIEITATKEGGFNLPPDSYYIKDMNLPAIAIECGSDLTNLSPRQEFGVTIGGRARHIRDLGNHAEAELDYLLARSLFPNGRELYRNGMALFIKRGLKMYIPGEIGSPETLADEVNLQCPTPRNDCRLFSGNG